MIQPVMNENAEIARCLAELRKTINRNRIKC